MSLPSLLLLRGKDNNMDIMAIGFYCNIDKRKIEQELLNIFDIQIIWDFEKYNIESEEGIKILQKYYNLKEVGILVDKKEKQKSFTSYPLIYEIFESILHSNISPRIFKLMDYFQNSDFHKLLFSFADYWDSKTLVRVEELSFQEAKKYLNKIYVWCKTYVDIIGNEEIRYDDHPLIIKITK